MSDYPEIAERFARETEHHETTVLLDEGVHRHVRFEDPRGRWFSLTTWPRKLVINGAAGTFVLSAATDDMFGMVRKSWGSGPNIQYWGEKVIASCVEVYGFAWHLLEARIAAELEKAESTWPGVKAAWDEHAFGWLSDYSISTASEAYRAVRDFSYTPEDSDGKPFGFAYWGDWQTNDWHPSWVWCCHAIAWGIARYDAAAESARAEAAQDGGA